MTVDDHDDGEDDHAEVLLDEGQVPEEVAGEHADRHPEQPADDVVAQEARVGHLPHPGHEGREGPDDGDEAGDDDRLPAVLLVEHVGLAQVLRVEEARPRVVEDLGTEVGADRVVGGVAQDGRRAAQREERPEPQRAQPREAPGREQQRIPREDRGDHHPGLQEHHREEQRVGLSAIALDDLGQVHVQVKDEVDEAPDEVHALPVSAAPPRRRAAPYLSRRRARRRKRRIAPWRL